MEFLVSHFREIFKLFMQIINQYRMLAMFQLIILSSVSLKLMVWRQTRDSRISSIVGRYKQFESGNCTIRAKRKLYVKPVLRHQVASLIADKLYPLAACCWPIVLSCANETQLVATSNTNSYKRVNKNSKFSHCIVESIFSVLSQAAAQRAFKINISRLNFFHLYYIYKLESRLFI